MICCGLERDSRFCPKCGKLMAPFNQDPPRWAEAISDPQTDGLKVVIKIYPDRHRMPVYRIIDKGEAKLLRDELTGILEE